MNFPGQQRGGGIYNLWLGEKSPFGCPFFRKNNLSAIHKQVFIRYNGSINSKEESL